MKHSNARVLAFAVIGVVTAGGLGLALYLRARTTYRCGDQCAEQLNAAISYLPRYGFCEELRSDAAFTKLKLQPGMVLRVAGWASPRNSDDENAFFLSGWRVPRGRRLGTVDRSVIGALLSAASRQGGQVARVPEFRKSEALESFHKRLEACDAGQACEDENFFAVMDSIEVPVLPCTFSVGCTASSLEDSAFARVVASRGTRDAVSQLEVEGCGTDCSCAPVRVTSPSVGDAETEWDIWGKSQLLPSYGGTTPRGREVAFEADIVVTNPEGVPWPPIPAVSSVRTFQEEYGVEILELRRKSSEVGRIPLVGDVFVSPRHGRSESDGGVYLDCAAAPGTCSEPGERVVFSFVGPRPGTISLTTVRKADLLLAQDDVLVTRVSDRAR